MPHVAPFERVLAGVKLGSFRMLAVVPYLLDVTLADSVIRTGLVPVRAESVGVAATAVCVR